MSLFLLVAPEVEAQPQNDSVQVASLIRTLEEDWARALVARDTTPIQRLLAPDFALVTSANPEAPLFRRDWLALLPQYQTHALPITRLTVRVLGDVAIASFVTDLRATVAGVDRSNVLFITDVWRRTGDTWQVIARYSSTPEAAGAGTQRLRSKP